MSSFEQRLISEIEYRLERSPVEESDDDVQHDEDSAGQGVAPSFDQKLKHYKVFEGMPVTFSCKVHGDPQPKVPTTDSNGFMGSHFFLSHNLPSIHLDTAFCIHYLQRLFL